MRRHFRVVGELEGTGRPMQGTVTIDGTYFQVRPYRSTRVYELPLSAVASMVCRKILIARVAEKRAAKKKKKGRRS